MKFINMVNHENKSDFSLIGFLKNILYWIAGGFCYGFIVGLGDDDSYHFAAIVGGHTILAGLLICLISISIKNSNLLNSFPRLQFTLWCSIVPATFRGINSFIVNVSPYIDNTEIMGNYTFNSLIYYAIFGALVGYISSTFCLKNNKTT